MAEEIQKIGWGENQTECETYAIPREPVLNVRASGSQGPNLFVYEEDGTTGHLFPSLGWMAEVEFADLIGFDDTGLTSISGSTIQEALASLDGIINPDVALSLADISLTSQNTLQQTFTVKPSTDFIINYLDVSESYSDLLRFGASVSIGNEFLATDILGFNLSLEGLSGNITLTAEGSYIEFASNGAFVESDKAYYFGDPDDDDSWRIIRDGTALAMQRKESSTWVTKSTITA
jgi:hypothetical protein